jgi:8-oxo-dGTP diphosphatase
MNKEPEPKKNSHCSYCGTRFTEQILWPRKCFRCYNDSFSNPLPVVVVMPVIERALSVGYGSVRQRGILIQKRGIDPQKGGWALTGGYMDAGETWQEAAVREVHEELNLNIKADELELVGIGASTKKDNVLIFCTPKGSWDWHGYDDPGLEDFFKKDGHIPNEEVLEVGVMWEPMELAFPTHNEFANKYLAKLKE